MIVTHAAQADNLILIVRIAAIAVAIGFGLVVCRALTIIKRRDAAQRDMGGFR
jgi:hypothetical protein